MSEKPSGQYSFLGVFFVGLLLFGVTANYYLNIEPHEERSARNRRIATEVNRLPHLPVAIATLPTSAK